MARRDADLCRGLACFLERHLAPLNGVAVVLQQLFGATEHDPKRKNWLMTNGLWSPEQLVAIPTSGALDLTHVLQGQARWTDGEVKVRLQLVDLTIPDILHDETIESSPQEMLPALFNMIGNVVYALTGSGAAARSMAALPTDSPAALLACVQGLAAAQAWHHGMGPAEAAYLLLVAAATQDTRFRIPCEALQRLLERCLQQGGEEAEFAEKALERLADQPEVHWPHFQAMRGLSLQRLGDADGAVARLESYLNQRHPEPLWQPAIISLSRLYRQRGNLDRARSALLETLREARGDDPAILEELALVYTELGSHREAERCWTRALQEEYDRPESLKRLGGALLQRGQAEPAAPLLLRAVELGSWEPDTVHALLGALLAADRLEEAEEVATEFLEDHGETPRAWMVLAEVRRRQGESVLAVGALHRAAPLIDAEADPALAQELELARFALRSPVDYEHLRRVRRQLGGGGNHAAAALFLRPGVWEIARKEPQLLEPWDLLVDFGPRGMHPPARLEALRGRIALLPRRVGAELEYAALLIHRGEPAEALRFLQDRSSGLVGEDLRLWVEATGKAERAVRRAAELGTPAKPDNARPTSAPSIRPASPLAGIRQFLRRWFGRG